MLALQPFDFFFFHHHLTRFFAHRITHKRELDMRLKKVPKIFAEILYNSNSNSYTSNNSNSHSKVDTIRITHNSIGNSNSNRLNRIVRTLV